MTVPSWHRGRPYATEPVPSHTSILGVLSVSVSRIRKVRTEEWPVTTPAISITNLNRSSTQRPFEELELVAATERLEPDLDGAGELVNTIRILCGFF